MVARLMLTCRGVGYEVPCQATSTLVRLGMDARLFGTALVAVLLAVWRPA